MSELPTAPEDHSNKFSRNMKKFPSGTDRMIRNWWRTKNAQIRCIKNMSKILNSHLSKWIYVRTSHRDSRLETWDSKLESGEEIFIDKFMNWKKRARSWGGKEKRFNYWIFTFLTQTRAIIQIHSLAFNSLLCISHLFDSTINLDEVGDKIIFHRTLNHSRISSSFLQFQSAKNLSSWTSSVFWSLGESTEKLSNLQRKLIAKEELKQFL